MADNARTRVEKQDLTHIAREIVRRQSRLAGRLEAATRLCDHIARRVEELADRLVSGGGSGTGPYPAVSARASRAARDALEAAARKGVTSLEIEWLAGRATVRVDDYAPFTLPENLAVLLKVLAEPTSASDDEGLVAWKKRDDVARALGQKLGRRVSRHALNQLLYRLRKELVGAGVNPELAQSSRRRGLRFALRSASALS